MSAAVMPWIAAITGARAYSEGERGDRRGPQL
jgi:hypothetical protein